MEIDTILLYQTAKPFHLNESFYISYICSLYFLLRKKKSLSYYDMS